MELSFYFDENVKAEILHGLRQRGVDVLTTQEDGRRKTFDELLLVRANELNRLLFTHDEDFLKIASSWQKQNKSFRGIFYVHQLSMTARVCIDELELVAKACRADEFENRVIYLPIKT